MFTVFYRFGHEKTHPTAWKKLEFTQPIITVEAFLVELCKTKFRRAETHVFEVYEMDGTKIEDLGQRVMNGTSLVVRRYPAHPRIVVRGIGSIVHWMM